MFFLYIYITDYTLYPVSGINVNHTPPVRCGKRFILVT